jgi:hypothetical protein
MELVWPKHILHTTSYIYCILCYLYQVNAHGSGSLMSGLRPPRGSRRMSWEASSYFDQKVTAAKYRLFPQEKGSPGEKRWGRGIEGSRNGPHVRMLSPRNYLLRAGQPGFDSQQPHRFSQPPSPHLLWGRLSPYPLGTEALSPWVERPGREASHSLTFPSSTEVKKEWRYTSITPYFMELSLTSTRNISSFTASI